MTTAAYVLGLLRPQINDNVAPYRHSDAALLRWLSDGQRLIAKLVPEAYPVTTSFAPTLGQPHQRLDESVAHALVRVEYNGVLSDPGATQIRHFAAPPYVFPAITPITSFGQTRTLPLPTGWEDEPGAILVVAFTTLNTVEASLIGLTPSVTYGGRAMTVVSLPTDFTTPLYKARIVTAIAMLELDPSDPPPTNVLSVSSPGIIQEWRGTYAVLKNVNVAATLAGATSEGINQNDFDPFQVGDIGYIAYDYNVPLGPVALTEGDTVLVMVASHDLAQISTDPVHVDSRRWAAGANPPTYDDNYSVLTQGTGSFTYVGNFATVVRPNSYVLMKHTVGETLYTDRWWYSYSPARTEVPIDERPLIAAVDTDFRYSPARSRAVRIHSLNGAAVAPVVAGDTVRVVDRDVLDTFSPDWTSRVPDPLPASGKYFQTYAKDHDDPLGFWLTPTPERADDGLVVTYIGIPSEITATGTAIMLGDTYVDPLVNYCAYRACMTQGYGYSPVAAAKAIARFGEQLKLSKATIEALTGNARRTVEQQT